MTDDGSISTSDSKIVYLNELNRRSFVISKLGILGGTFNPIHYGHLAAAEEVRDRLKLDRVLFIPSYLPPHKHEEDVPSAAQRMEMVRLAISGNASFRTIGHRDQARRDIVHH